jgi:hypothetical protein
MKNFKYRLNAWVITAAVVIAVILVNLLVTEINKKVPLKIDMTAGRQFEITNETKEALKKLDKDIKISVLGTEDSVSAVTKEYIGRYRAMSDKLNFSYIDIYKNQNLLYTYEQKGENLSQSDLLLECEGRYKIVAASGLYSQSYSFDEGQSNYSFELESKLTNAIVTVSGMVSESAVYFLEGHGESSASYFTDIIKNQGHKSSTISIVNSPVPEDAKLLIAFVPNADFSEDECNKIDDFLENGGNFLAVYTPGVSKMERFEKYLTEWGITPRQSIALEEDAGVAVNGYQGLAFYAGLNDHDITKNIKSQSLSFLIFQSIDFDLTASNTQRATVTPIVTTSPNGLAKRNLEDIRGGNLEYADGDVNGAVVVAAVSEKTYPNVSRVAAFGSATSLESLLSDSSQRGNIEFASNLVNWLTNNTENLTIPAKIVTEGKITKLTAGGLTAMYYVLVWAIPLIILALGIVIWLRRRYL